MRWAWLLYLCCLQFVLCVAVLGVFVGHCSKHTLIISVSLAHVSEFSFVLSSRARRMGIISREVTESVHFFLLCCAFYKFAC